MNKKFLHCITIQIILALFCIPPDVQGFESKSRYVTLQYASKDQLREFNDELYISRSLRRMMRKKNIVTIEDEVLAKIDIIIEKAQVVLDMFPDTLHIGVVLLADADEVAEVYKNNYGSSASHIAYYSLKQKTIYISIDDTNLEVFSHEVGHAVVDHYFKVRPPHNIHELMAQFTAKHISD